VWYASRRDHLPPEKLPALQSSDEVSYLITKSFPKIDPTLLRKKRHVILSLLSIFKWDYALVMLLILSETGTMFVAPVGLNRILSYLENPDSSLIRPWVWIIWLGTGPLVGVMFAEWYAFVTSRMLVRAQAIVTQLVFVHALRIRLNSADKQKGDAKDSAIPESVPSDAAADQDTQSTIAAESSSSERSASPAPSTSTITPSDADSSNGSQAKEEGSKDEKQNSKQIIGKINNLVTSDMDAMNQAKDFPYLSECYHRRRKRSRFDTG
jgi:hypothetical protein